MKMKMIKRKQIRHVSRPRSRHGYKYSKYRKCLDMMILIFSKQHLSNIWSWIHEKVKQLWDWVEKQRLLENRNVILWIAISHVIKSTILIDRKYLSNYIVQSSYCVYEIKLLTALLYKTLKQNERLLQTCQILKQNLIESLCALNMYINNIINEKNMRLKIEDNAR